MTAAEIVAIVAKQSARWNPLEDLFPEQRAFVLDPAKRKTARCTRRAGKTKSLAHYLLSEGMAGADASCLYVGLTRTTAKRQVWEECLRIISTHGLPARVNHSELTIRFGKRSPIIFTGADDQAQIEKLRGDRYKLAAVDEAQSFPPYLKTMVDEVLSPALMDVDGTLVLAGTPGPLLQGLFYEATTTAQGWARHRWSVLNNPHVAGGNAAAWIEAEKQRRGWTEYTAGFLREYRGEWVRSDEELIYHYDPARNDFEALPDGDWNYVLGVDVGYRDLFAIVPLAYSDYLREAYFLEPFAKSGMIPAEWAAKIQEFVTRYKPERVVMDSGALGKPIAEEFRRRYGLPITPAEKTEKRAFIEVVNSELRQGHLKARSDSPLVEEWRVLQWDAKEKERPEQHNDIADAALYAYRYARNYIPKKKPPENEDPIEREILRRHEDAIERERHGDTEWTG